MTFAEFLINSDLFAIRAETIWQKLYSAGFVTHECRYFEKFEDVHTIGQIGICVSLRTHEYSGDQFNVPTEWLDLDYPIDKIDDAIEARKQLEEIAKQQSKAIEKANVELRERKLLQQLQDKYKCE